MKKYVLSIVIYVLIAYIVIWASVATSPTPEKSEWIVNAEQ